MITFKKYFQLCTEKFTLRPGDLYFHGSLGDFEKIKPDLNHGLAYVTRNLQHALEYAAPRSQNFGSSQSSNPGYVYVYKIDPRANILDAKDSNNFKGMFSKGFNSYYGYTEIIQQDDVMSRILKNGWDGVLQRQADVDSYGDLRGKFVNRSRYISKRDGKDKWKQRIPMDYENAPFAGTEVLGIKPEFLIFVKKIPWSDVALEDDLKQSYKNIKRPPQIRE